MSKQMLIDKIFIDIIVDFSIPSSSIFENITLTYEKLNFAAQRIYLSY
jgi:hypothetical protein